MSNLCETCAFWDLPCNSEPCDSCKSDGPCLSNWQAVEAAKVPNPNPNPKQAAGDLKDPLDLLPVIALREEAKVLKSGADKYGRYNWRASDALLIMTYVAAIMRHLFLFVDGEDLDKESGLCHLAHIRASCAILMDARRVGNLTDDRPKLAEELCPTKKK